ncbi:hypothetical protein DAMA08_004790 [Martiniozyma asiatica (nom. inval.)]|nr:hypothetical protein DAMA08_004790 [Martiniozyma asiatica]
MSNYRQYQQIIKLASSEYRPQDVTNCMVKKSATSPKNSLLKEKKKITRTKSGCFCCRKRKKKCDEQKPACSGCIRNNLECVYPDMEHIHKSSARKVKKSIKQDEKVAAFILSEMSRVNHSFEKIPTSPCQPSMSTPSSGTSSPQHSDIESPLTSPHLKAFGESLAMKAMLPFSLNKDPKPEFSHQPFIMPSRPNTGISIKSLLN